MQSRSSTIIIMLRMRKLELGVCEMPPSRSQCLNLHMGSRACIFWSILQVLRIGSRTKTVSRVREVFLFTLPTIRTKVCRVVSSVNRKACAVNHKWTEPVGGAVSTKTVLRCPKSQLLNHPKSLLPSLRQRSLLLCQGPAWPHVSTSSKISVSLSGWASVFGKNSPFPQEHLGKLLTEHKDVYFEKQKGLTKYVQKQSLPLPPDDP